ncbi:MAG: glycoside hydrolase family 43 protein [Gammaproteobacteria bacterium]|nr:glycoside hydrolase family 43 protein [Gammaproteobacteria bacterium]
MRKHHSSSLPDSQIAVFDEPRQEVQTFIHNPILRGFNPDPSICRVGTDYYVATSTFEWFPGVQIHHSRDLVHWRLLTHALQQTRLIDLQGVPSSGGIWAPALTHHDGTFYLCYTVVHQHESATKDTPNFLTAARSIHGEWSDPIRINASGFDPSLFHDDDGKKYWLNMVWDHRPGRHPFYGIALQEYDHDKKCLTGESRIIFKGSKLGLTEGPHLYKRNGWYYLLTAEGGTEYEHAVTLARSRSLYGPYEIHPHNPILTSVGHPEALLQKAGHASLVETPQGESFLVHLCGRPLPGTRRCNLGRETAIQGVKWETDDWLYLAGGGQAPREVIVAPKLPACPWPEQPSRLPFDAPDYATPRGPSASVNNSAEELVLFGSESLESCFDQAMLARRLTHQRSRATTRLTFSPQSFQQMAGLTAYYNNRLFHYLYLSHDEQLGCCLQIHSCDDGKSSFPLNMEPVQVPPQPLFLRLEFLESDLRFFWSEDGHDFKQIGPTLDASILSDDYGKHWGFTGTFIGMACQDLTGQQASARFDFLEYTILK